MLGTHFDQNYFRIIFGPQIGNVSSVRFKETTVCSKLTSVIVNWRYFNNIAVEYPVGQIAILINLAVELPIDQESSC